MMTLLLGFFIILYSFSHLDEKKFDEISKEFVDAFEGEIDDKMSSKDLGLHDDKRKIQALHMLISILNLGRNMEQTVAEIESLYNKQQVDELVKKKIIELQEKLDQQKSEVFSEKNTDNDFYLSIILPGDISFKPGRHEITAEAKKIISDISRKLYSISNLVSIEVIGHSDSTMPSANALFTDNYGLSSARAGQVALELIRHGHDSRKISVAGMADLRPIAKDYFDDGRANLEGRAANRRVEIRIRRSEIKNIK